MSAPEHWLLQTVDQYLDEHNRRVQPLVPGHLSIRYTAAQFRAMVFHRGCVLVVKQNQRWTVPSFVGQHGANETEKIYRRLLNTLHANAVPLDILRQIQFMEFSLLFPHTKTNLGISDRLTMDIILTTSTLGNVPNWNMSAPPADVNMRFAWVTGLHDDLPFFHWNEEILSVEDVRNAQDRLGNLDRNAWYIMGPPRPLYRAGAEALQIIVITKILVGDVTNGGRGWIALKGTYPNTVIALLDCTQADRDPSADQTVMTRNGESLPVAGSWKPDTTTVRGYMNDFWMDVMDPSGRLKVVVENAN